METAEAVKQKAFETAIKADYGFMYQQKTTGRKKYTAQPPTEKEILDAKKEFTRRGGKATRILTAPLPDRDS